MSSGSDLDFESILVYPDNVKPLLVWRHSVWQKTGVSLNNMIMSCVACHVSWYLVRHVARVSEALQEALVAVAGVVAIEAQVGPLRKDT